MDQSQKIKCDVLHFAKLYNIIHCMPTLTIKEKEIFFSLFKEFTHCRKIRSNYSRLTGYKDSAVVFMLLRRLRVAIVNFSRLFSSFGTHLPTV